MAGGGQTRGAPGVLSACQRTGGRSRNPRNRPRMWQLRIPPFFWGTGSGISITSSITTKTTLGQWPLAVARLTPVSGQALPRWDLPAVPRGVTSHEGVHSTFSTSPRWRSEKAMAPHSSTLAWKIPWMEEPGRLQSMGSLRVGHDFTFTFHFHALEKEMATHSSVLAWRIPGTGEPGGLPSMGSHRVGHD